MKIKTLRKFPLMKMWFEDGELFLWVNERSGLYHFDFPDGYQANFLVDLEKTGKKRKSTVYKYKGIRKNK